jgi:Fe-S oxidoreductase
MQAINPVIEIADVVAEYGGESLHACMQCGTCTGVCPWGLVNAYSPRQILRQVSLGLDGAEEAVWRCVTCNTCVSRCPRGVELIDVLRAVRALMVEQGTTPEGIRGPLSSMHSDGNPWNGKREERMEWAKGLEVPAFSPDQDYCFFTCCTLAYDPRNKKVGRALIRLLQRAGLSFGMLDTQESCCGDQARKLGADDVFSELARSNIELFQERGVRRALVASPHCLNAFTKDYRELDGAVSSEHYTEVLDSLIADGKLSPTGEVGCTVTFHDPCYLGRHNGIYDAPRRVLQSIPGLKLVEMPRCRENSLCCGGGGGGAWGEYDVEERFAVLRVREALETGAEVIATACPYCTLMLEDAVGVLNAGDQIAVRDVAELLAQSVGVENAAAMGVGSVSSGRIGNG